MSCLSVDECTFLCCCHRRQFVFSRVAVIRSVAFVRVGRACVVGTSELALFSGFCAVSAAAFFVVRADTSKTTQQSLGEFPSPVSSFASRRPLQSSSVRAVPNDALQ